MTDKRSTVGLDWEDVRFFAALARHRTLAATARDLNESHATVARRLANLEATLGHSLFKRRAKNFSLNAAGAGALAEAAQMEMAACALMEKREAASSLAAVAGVRTRHRRSSGPRARRNLVGE